MGSTCIQYTLKLSINAYYSTCDRKNGAEMKSIQCTIKAYR